MRNATPSRSRTTGPARRERGVVMAVLMGEAENGRHANREAAQCFQRLWPMNERVR